MNLSKGVTDRMVYPGANSDCVVFAEEKNAINQAFVFCFVLVFFIAVILMSLQLAIFFILFRNGLKSTSCRLSRSESERRCQVPDGKLCSGRGQCDCGICICQVTEPGKYYGPLCECHEWVCETYGGEICAGKQEVAITKGSAVCLRISPGNFTFI